ncbi:MAG TPA: hypothetical protein VN959_13410 [Mycobacterium sp.]|nr:hypothetical protein [Mycobacterium sp.]
MTEYLRLSDFFAIARIYAGLDPEVLLASDEVVSRAQRALYAPIAKEAGVEVYPDDRDKSAVLAFMLMRERPLPEKNIPVAHECMKEFLYRNGYYFDKSKSAIDPIPIWQAIANDEAGAFDTLRQWVYECT